ncbi:MAG TPA: MipA/OmpV family protein [Falsiroseomonas sp.]|nr:MipA/OmpV family protein [Falsiroseomonas sp.]
MSKFIFCVAALMALTAGAPALGHEARQPLLEAGIFLGAGLLPDYPAAEDAEARALALPWVVYRGQIVQSDERGVRGRLYRSTDLELTLNLNGALASNSSDGVREGMPDLEYLGEIGPSLRWTAWRDEARRTRLSLELPLRAAFSTDLSRIRHRGFVFAPEIALERLGVLTSEGRARIGIGPVFASGGLMDYWYRVKPNEARPDRPAFNADGGYLGIRMQFSYRTPLTERVWLTAGGRLENFAGATNGGSPLFRSEFNATIVGGISVTLYRTEATVASSSEPFD